MSEYAASIEWTRDGQPFVDQKYSRAHDWRFDGGAVVRGSSAPSSVPLPYSDPAAVDPEEALVAAASSCHMLVFLHLAAKAGFVVDRYADAAVGRMARDDRGKTSIVEIVLKPDIAWSGPAPEAAALDDLHHRAHSGCYIANSIRAEVRVEAP